VSKANSPSNSAADEEIVTYPFGPPEPPPRAPRRRRRFTTAGVAIAVVLSVIAVFVALRQLPDNDALGVGDCAVFTPGASSRYHKADCADGAAQYVVLAVNPETDCAEVPGATRSLTLDDAQLCFGDKGADPALAINGAQVGDCVAFSPYLQRRAPCTALEATHVVSQRLTRLGAQAAEEACGSDDEVFGIAWSDIDNGREPTWYDLVLCLTVL
jgi:hypothetical protein